MARLIRSKGFGPAPAVRTGLIWAALALPAGAWGTPGLAQTDEPIEQQRLAQEADDAALVACLLPAQIERYGTQLTIVGARQRIETSRADCVERGGEVVEEGAPATEPAR